MDTAGTGVCVRILPLTVYCCRHGGGGRAGFGMWPARPVVRLRLPEEQDLIFKAHPQLSEVCGGLRNRLRGAEANSKPFPAQVFCCFFPSQIVFLLNCLKNSVRNCLVCAFLPRNVRQAVIPHRNPSGRLSLAKYHSIGFDLYIHLMTNKKDLEIKEQKKRTIHDSDEGERKRDDGADSWCSAVVD